MEAPFVLNGSDNKGILSLLSAIEQSGDSFPVSVQDSVFTDMEHDGQPQVSQGEGVSGLMVEGVAELCLVCGQLGTEAAQAGGMVDVFLEELGGRRLYCKIEEIVSRRVGVRSSSLICQACFGLLKSIQELELKLIELKTNLTSKFAFSNPLKKKNDQKQSPKKKAVLSSMPSMYEPIDFSDPVMDVRMPLDFLADTSCQDRKINVTKGKSNTNSRGDEDHNFNSSGKGALQNIEIMCPTCSKTFKSNNLLLKHQKTHLCDLFSCSQCDQNFVTKRELREHFKFHEERKVFICDYCQKELKGQKSLYEHIASKHNQEKRYMCAQCPGVFASRHLKNVHEREHSGEKSCICDLCGESFATAQSLSHHKSRHTGDYAYNCDFCNKGFNNLKLMEEHRHIHSGKKPYVCTKCSKGFANRGSLWLHMKQHDTSKPYICGDCNKSFTHSSHLAVHKRIHTGEKPYKCRICAEGFISSNHLKRHMKNHANQPAFACGICKQTFDQRRQLVSHGNEVHGGNVIDDQGSAEDESREKEDDGFSLVLEGNDLVSLGNSDEVSNLIQIDGQELTSQHRLVDLVNQDGVSLGQTIVLIQMQDSNQAHETSS